MICKSCAEYADKGFRGWNHENPMAPAPAGDVEKVCKGGTHCDCQHKEPGTAINKVPALSDLAKRINEGLPIA